MKTHRTIRRLLLTLAALVWSLPAPSPALAQMQPIPDRPAGEGEGPFEKLIVKGAMMVEGSGAPPEGPVDIEIQGNRITAISGSDRHADAYAGAQLIEADGMYVLPGFVDVHGHNGDPDKADQPSYGFKLWLAHGVTSVRGVSFAGDLTDLDMMQRSAANTITAPRLYPYAVFGSKWDRGRVDNPAKAREWVRWIKARGYWGIKFFNNESPAVLEAALDEADAQGLGSVAHLGQRGLGEVTARRAVELGMDGITHFYGHFESIPRSGQLAPYPADYNYRDEQSRFGEVALRGYQAVDPGSEKWDEYVDFLVERGVTLSPTFNIYVASRDVMRARNLDWHERYTLPSLMDFYRPSLTNHGSYYHDWGTEQEVAWRHFFTKWMRLTKDFHDRGGRVTTGSDPGYIYQTWGFAYIAELEMLREAGLTPLEVIKAATLAGAREIYDPSGEEPPMGRIAVGRLADLVIVPENPLANLKVLYGTGHDRLNRGTNEIETIGGVRWTIKDGVVFDAPALLEDVAQMVAEQKAKRADAIP